MNVGKPRKEKHVPRSVTFVATSNRSALEPLEFAKQYGSEAALTVCDSIKLSKTFQTAFEKAGSEPSIIQSSSVRSITNNETHSGLLQDARYGLISAIMTAYNRHHNLILRPDDIWQAILTQFSFYVNANAEDLRDCFVDFHGKKTLVVYMPPGTLFSTDFASFANRMVDEKIATNLKDREVTTWLLPKFTTTTTEDRVAASVTIMSTLQAYFEYVCCLCCGIPHVTLEGTPEDWRLLREKIKRLPQYDVKGKEAVMKKWYNLLALVLDQFVQSAEGRPDLHFWDTVCSRHGGGSGPSYISGWVAVFACFKANGKWQGDVPGRAPDDYGFESESQSAPKWPFIDTSYIPVGSVSVPVLVDDNGTQYDTQMLAGQFAFEVVAATSDQKMLDTIRPRTDWCIAYTGSPKTEPRAYKDGEIIQD